MAKHEYTDDAYAQMLRKMIDQDIQKRLLEMDEPGDSKSKPADADEQGQKSDQVK